MDSEGVLQKEVIYAKLGSGKSDEVKAVLFKRIDGCIAIANENVDKRAWEINNCLYGPAANEWFTKLSQTDGQ